MIADTLASLVVYAVMALGLGWPLAARLVGHVDATEKLLTATALSLLGVFFVAWVVYVLKLPLLTLWALPLLSVLGLAESRGALREAWRDRELRDLVIGQVIVTAWCVGWLALVFSYSGGAWAGDWFGHWLRTVFFLHHGPLDVLFYGTDPLTSRPPLGNIVIGAYLAVTKTDFAHYQLASTFLGSLAFLPAALLARRFAFLTSRDGPAGGLSVSAQLAVLFMLNPLWLQNATFAWTKLPAAFFTLASVHYFLRAREADARHAGLLCAATLAAALLTHYSAGPYAVVLALAWLIRGWTRRRDPTWWRETATAGAVGAAVLATWFGWALLTYGAGGTFLTNTSVTDQAADTGTQLWNVALNLRDTVVPHFLREVDYGFIAQSSPWGWWRDWFFLLYQVNLLPAFGSVAWLVILMALWRRGRATSSGARASWIAAIVGTLVMGVAVHGARDTWGLAHICLQPLVLAGLAFLGASWNGLGRGWRRALVAGATIDFALGIALHFGAQSLLLDQWLAPGRTSGEIISSYGFFSAANLRAKLQNNWAFFGDALAASEAIALTGLAAVLLLALVRVKLPESPS